MNWPAQSLDLNPIEKLWDSDIEAENPTPSASLWTSVREVWNAIPQNGLKLSMKAYHDGANK